MKIETLDQLSSIPDEILIYEILKRLPVKTLCRFKAVSKRLLSVITSRPFIDSHFQHSNLNPTCLFGFYNKDTTTTQHPPTFFSKNYPQTSSYNWPDKYYRWCSISPRGLICGGRKDTEVEVWNPSTGEHIELSLPPRNSTTTSYLFQGFDPVGKKHKLLLISSSSNGGNYVFTLGENTWRMMDNNSSSNNLTPIIGENCCIDGVVYFLAQRDQNDDDDDDDELVLVRFDVGSECFIEPIRLPEKLVPLPIEYDYFTLGIYVYRGRILLLNYDYLRTHGFQMWVLEKHNKWSPKRLIPWSPPSPGIYNVGFIDGKGLLFYSSELNSEEAIFRVCSYDLEKGSCWTETTFPDLKKKLDGSVRYEVRLYSYVDTLESLN